MRNGLSSVSVDKGNDITSEVVAVSREKPHDPAPRNPKHEQMQTKRLSRCEEADYKKCVGKESGFQGNEVHAHLEEGIPPRPVVQHHVPQRNAQKEVARDHAARSTGEDKAEKQHPHEIRLVTRKGVRLQSPHALRVENGGHEEPHRERSRICDGQQRPEELLLMRLQRIHSRERKQIHAVNAEVLDPLLFCYVRKCSAGMAYP